MSPKNYFALSGTVFAIVFVAHFLRLINAWEANIGGWDVPMWVSWLAVALTGYLVWKAHKLKK